MAWLLFCPFQKCTCYLKTLEQGGCKGEGWDKRINNFCMLQNLIWKAENTEQLNESSNNYLALLFCWIIYAGFSSIPLFPSSFVINDHYIKRVCSVCLMWGIYVIFLKYKYIRDLILLMWICVHWCIIALISGEDTTF